MSTSLQQSLVVMRREVRTKLANRSFLLSLVGALLLVVLVAVLQHANSSSSRSTAHVTVEAAPSARPVAQEICQAWHQAGLVAECQVASPGTLDRSDPDLSTVSVAGAGTHAVLHMTTPASLAGDGATVASATAWRSLAIGGGATPAQVQVHPAIVQTAGSKMPQLLAAALGCGFLFAGLMVGQQLAGSIVEDKKLRVYDTLRQAMSLRALTVGKLMANVLISLVQLGALVVAFIILRRALPSGTVALHGTAILVSFVPLFVLGYLTVCLLWALIGLRANSVDALRDASLPLTMGLMGLWFTAMYAHGSVQAVLSYLPVASAMVMPMRVALGQASMGALVMSASISAIAAAALVVPLRSATASH